MSGPSWMEVASFFLSMISFILVLLGLLAWRFSRRLRQPHLVIEAKGHSRKKSVTILRIFVKNSPVTGRPKRALLTAIGRDDRPVAEQCRFTVDVRRNDGEEIIRGMPGRWNDAPEPLVPYIPSLKYPSKPMRRQKYNRKIRGIPSMAHAVDKTLLDLFPGDDDAGAGIFIKRKGEARCYGFNTGSYFWKGYRHKDFGLNTGKYDVTVRFRCGSYETCASFELINRGTETDEFHFNLKPMKCCK